jgi:hypothetical protein
MLLPLTGVAYMTLMVALVAAQRSAGLVIFRVR